MPRIADTFVECVLYIYGSKQDARSGESQGGSGFVVAIPSGMDDSSSVYAVTAGHVVANLQSPVLRLNRKDGTTDILETQSSEWHHHVDGDDVAVCSIDTLDAEIVQMLAISMEMFVSDRLILDEDIGIGDDTIMVGRFINHEGKQQNTPAVRFGSIAMMPRDRIQSDQGLSQESFLVEMRSLPGYSGSAVFIYSPNAANDMSLRRYGRSRKRLAIPEGKSILDAEYLEEFRGSLHSLSPKGPYLLGIDWCHIRNKRYVYNSDRSQAIERPYILENTGMAGVLPAWKITELLNSEELVKKRKKLL